MTVVAVHAVVTGQAEAPVVVLSNSLGSPRRMWDAQLPELKRHFRVARYDTCGRGASPVPHGGYSIDDLADDVQLPPAQAWLDRAWLVRTEGTQAVATSVVGDGSPPRIDCADESDATQPTTGLVCRD
jgi:3-oxoadipate enol-lactonase